MTCPNRNHPDFIANSKEYGEFEANTLIKIILLSKKVQFKKYII
jgi:hypothetical protein